MTVQGEGKTKEQFNKLLPCLPREKLPLLFSANLSGTV